MKKYHILLTITLVCLSILSFGQSLTKYFQSNLIRVYNFNNKEYSNPFVGGIKSPVIENFDLNGDGIQDLVVIDRIDNKLLTFINEGAMKFFYRPEYEKFFPDSLSSFIKFRDYNGDGKPDIFTYAGSGGAGIAVYKNISNAVEGIKFALVSPELSTYFYGNYSLTVNLPMFLVDIPEIIDVDNDGDLDILSFDEAGGVWLQLYNNMSMELYGNKDSLLFTCVDNYWGDFYETETTNDVILNSIRQWGYRKYNQNYDSLKKAWGISKVKEQNNVHHTGASMKKTPQRHAGSTVFANDMDGDSDLDLIIGDIAYSGLNFLENGKKDNSLTIDKIKKSQMLFPANDVSVDIRNMPNCNYIDVDNDGVKDFVFSPTDLAIIDTFQSLDQVWLYLNKGQNNNVVPKFQKKNFLQSDMIDLGGASSPAFVDFDADGDLDLLVATKGDFYQSYYLHDFLVLFENIGNKDTAVFKLINNDYLNFSQKSYLDIVPSIGDIDGDDDVDLLLGQSNGKLIFYQNIAGSGKAVDFVFVSDNFKNVDVGNYSAPCISDIDKDSLNDLVIGQSAGKLSYYRNTGTKNNPDFTLVSDTFGNILFPKSDHFTTPAIYDLDSNGFNDLVIAIDILNLGTAIIEGKFYFYKDIQKDITGTFEMVDSVILDAAGKVYLKSSFGNRLRPAIARLDGDSKPDLIAGNLRGGLLFFGTNNSVFTEIKANKVLTLCTNDSIELDAGEGFDTYLWNTGATSRKIFVTTAKTYSCTVRKGSFTYTAYATVKQHPGSVVADFSYQGNERDYQFTTLNQDILQIYWDFGDGDFSFDLNPFHHFLQQGNYKVCMSIKDRCGASDNECKNIFVVSGIQENKQDNEIDIYPNPVFDKLFVSLPEQYQGNNFMIKIYDQLGQNVLQRSIFGENMIILPINTLINGTYCFVLIDHHTGKILNRKMFLKF